MIKLHCFFHFLLCSLLTSVLSTEEGTSGILHQNERKLWDYLFKNYDIKIRPANNSESIVVYFDIIIRHIVEVNPATQTINLQAWTWMDWKDVHFHWNSSEFGNIDALRVPANMIWKPDILLYSSGEGKEIDHFADTFVVLYNGGHVIWVPPASFISLCNIDLQYYPYDEQNCTLKFGSWTHDAMLIDIQTQLGTHNETFNMESEDFFDNNEWKLVSVQGKRNEKKYDCCPEVYVDLDVYIKIKRRPNVFSLTLILTSILCILTTLCIFFLQPYDGKRIIILIVNLGIISLFLLFLSYHLPPMKDTVPIIAGSAAATASLTWIALAISVLLNKMTSETWITAIPEKIKFVFIDTIGNILRLTPDGIQSNTFLYRQMDDTKILVEETIQGTEENITTKEKRETETQNKKMWFTMAIILNRLFLILYIVIIIILIIVMIS